MQVARKGKVKLEELVFAFAECKGKSELTNGKAALSPLARARGSSPKDVPIERERFGKR